MKLNKQQVPGKHLYFYADDMFIKGFYISDTFKSYCYSNASNNVGYQTWLGGMQFNIL